MLHAFRVSLTLLLWVSTVWAQSPGNAKGAVHRHVTGLGLRLPPNWSAQDQAEAVHLVPSGVEANAGITELYVAATQEGYSSVQEAQFVQALSAGFVGSGGKLVSSGDREIFTAANRAASLYTWEVADPASQKQYLLHLYLSPEGSRAFVVVAAGPVDLVRSRDSALRQVLTSMTFDAPAIAAGSALADGTPLAQKWLVKLRGKTVKQFISGGGAAGEKVLVLGRDGAYSFRSSVAIAADVPGVSASSIGRKSTSGRWHIGESSGRAFLQLVNENGEQQLLSLTMDDRTWYLNGEKAFAVDQ
jgi:hypothetical protein